MFVSASRLDLRFFLTPPKKGDMETIMSHFPPLPIDIDYDNVDILDRRNAVNINHLYAALKRPNRIRQITLWGSNKDLDDLFIATKYPLPALEGLNLRGEDDIEVNIPATFLKGSNLQLRTLKLDHVSLLSISRLLSSVPALTYLSLAFDCNVRPELAISHLSYLQGMPFLRHLELYITCLTLHLALPTNAQERFTLPKLASFRYRGQSAFLNTFVFRFTAPSLRGVDIKLRDSNVIDPSILHLSRFIEDIAEHCHAVQVVIERYSFRLLLRGPSKYAGHHSLYFELTTKPFHESMMQISGPFSAKLITAEELSFCFVDDRVVGVIPWRQFLMQFPSVKALRIYGDNNRGIASALYQSSLLHRDHGGYNLAFLPALEEIELCMGEIDLIKLFRGPYSTPEGRASELAAFEPSVSARQQAGIQVKVVANMRSLHFLERGLAFNLSE
jgi:hypothetical protein